MRRADSSTSFVVGGVPEPMNLPWQLAVADGTFADAQLDVDWVEQPGGTGAIAAALSAHTLDAATILTEGAIAAIVNGADLRICSLWVQSPLIWGVHVSGERGARTIHDFEPVRFAVSRLGSGSHLMAYLLAARDGFALSVEQLVVVGDIDGAREALHENRADVFLWEKYMTSPLVHTGEFRRIDTIDTPWPSFAIAAHIDTFASRARDLDRLIVVAQRAATQFARHPKAAERIVSRYGLTRRDADEWLDVYDFAGTTGVPAGLVEDVQDRLLRVGAIASKKPAADIVARAAL
ncbi:MAG TPA: ABC transporter substrate-binding protein [Acidimicrobiales bacterium]|nr:ABC transporter substrate-binding protein [Acidimicrobiales bacterium]